jgi:RNA polymerase sigma-70 factor (ECF subfamily)
MMIPRLNAFTFAPAAMQELQSLLAADITVYAHSGGKVAASPEPIVGLESVMQLHRNLAMIIAKHMSQVVRYALINGVPGFVTMDCDGILQTTALQIEGGKVVAVYVTLNPDKPRHVGRG